ncbi:hypothetical protein DGMP_26210 [Desulfomarina profundi]|uniref:ABC transporter permease n=2 Tax=Desulfomarina profundi TaxID=2772557 RepID=A0A8D5FMQ6_9BACT|nr:hypothetical protein DGMP_26210 [Desulfomarina profundi]
MRVLLMSPALWGMLVILSLLVGYSFIQAVELYSQASRTALAYPEMAAGMNPLDGIFIPTFGACYLVETLLFPLVVIRLVGQDRQDGTVKLLLQLPLSPFLLNAVKIFALTVVWFLAALPGISVFIIWHVLGGAIYYPEIICLFTGHTLYFLVIACIAMFATVITTSLPTAAMICLAVTLGSWVLDFTAAGGGWSLTTLLRGFEGGLLSSDGFVVFLGLSLFLFSISSVLLHPGQKTVTRVKKVFATALIFLLAVSGFLQIPQYLDMTENHRHSFNPADERLLKQMKKRLKITVHLAKEDGRLYDLEHGILAKLRRILPDIKIIYADTGATGLYGAPEDDTYGLIVYEYAGRKDQSYSNSPGEILPLLHALAAQKVTVAGVSQYRGHPLVEDAASARWWFYVVLPLFFLLAAWGIRRPQVLSRKIQETI